MAKYAPGITLKQQCRYEIAEMRKRLLKYSVPEKEIKIIGEMICEGYNQAIQANASGNVLNSMLLEVMGKDDYYMKFAKPIKEGGTINQDGYLARLEKYMADHPDLFLDGDEENCKETAG